MKALFKFFDRFRSVIPVSALPRVLTTQTAGELKLNVRYMIFRDGQLEFIDEDALFPGNEIRMRFCHYTSELPGAGIKATFHPPEFGCVNAKKWIEVFDTQYVSIRDSWREMLRSKPTVIEHLLREYGEDSLKLDDLLPTLSLSKIKISSDGSFELGFEPFERFPSLDMRVEFGADRSVIEAAFGG